jgi:hypothetical protein
MLNISQRGFEVHPTLAYVGTVHPVVVDGDRVFLNYTQHLLLNVHEDIQFHINF